MEQGGGDPEHCDDTLGYIATLYLHYIILHFTPAESSWAKLLITRAIRQRDFRIQRCMQRRMGTLLPKKLLSCRPRNDGPYDGPTIPSTPSQGSIDGGRGRHSARQYVGRVLSREVVEQ